MKIRLSSILLASACLLAGCSHSAGHTEEHEEGAEAHDAHEHAAGVIVLDTHEAERFGVKVDTLRAQPFRAGVKVSATVQSCAHNDALVASPTSGIVQFAAGVEPGSSVGAGALIATVKSDGISGGNPDAAAAAALEAARTEYERIENLYKEQLATVGERNAALAAYRAAQASYSPAAATSRATSPIAGVVTGLAVRQGQYVQPGDIIATVASDDHLSVRVELPQRYAADESSFTDVILDVPGHGAVDVIDAGGRRVAGAMPAGVSAYVPVYFVVPHTGGLTSGGAYTAHLLGAERPGVLSVPVGALSEQQGQFFVYEHLGDDHYAKRPVSVGASDGHRMEITGGVEAGIVLVMEGATVVRLAESSANIPEGHTHNH